MSIPTISPAEARRLIDQGAVLIDVRQPDEHARERIAGARCQPLSSLADAKLEDGTVIFHCRSGMRTAAYAPALAAAAEGPCYILEGGVDGWKKAGFATEIDRKVPIDLMRQVQISAGLLVLLGVLGGLFLTPALFGLAGFVGAGLTFAGLSGFCGMARLLALMPWNRALKPA